MCTVHGAALTVGKIKQYKGGSPPSAGQMTAQKEKACGAAPTCNELSSCTFPSPSPGKRCRRTVSKDFKQCTKPPLPYHLLASFSSFAFKTFISSQIC